MKDPCFVVFNDLFITHCDKRENNHLEFSSLLIRDGSLNEVDFLSFDFTVVNVNVDSTEWSGNSNDVDSGSSISSSSIDSISIIHLIPHLINIGHSLAY
jgi:hypothetical protein